MQAYLWKDPEKFLAAAGPFFQTDPFSANVIAVVASRLASSGESEVRDDLWASVVDATGEVRGVAMHTPPHALFVSRMPREAAVALAEALAGTGRNLDGVNGACDSTGAFADRWAARTGRLSTVVTAMRMYRLGALRRPQQVSGGPRRAASPRDVELAATWLAAFHDEATPRAPAEDWTAFARRRIIAGQVHLWSEGGAPVSLAGVSDPAAGVARVGPVYSPPGARRNGYGAAITAEATAAALASGAQHVVLYTDLANPTSNSIYQAIGYEPDHDAEERVFGV